MSRELRSYSLVGWKIILRGSDPDFNMQRSYRNLGTPQEGWNVKFTSETEFEADLVRTRTNTSGLLLRGSYRWVPNMHTRDGVLELRIEEGLERSASEYGRVLSLTLKADDPLATSSWGPIYALFDPEQFPSPSALREYAIMQQTVQPIYNESRYMDSRSTRTTPAPGLWTTGLAPETAAFVREIA